MYLPSVTTLGLLLVAGIRGNYCEFGKLIGRIKTEIEPSTVYLIGVDDNHLSEISNKDVNMPVAIFTHLQSDFSKLRDIQESTILVVQVGRDHHRRHVIGQFVLRLRVRMFVVIIAHSHQVFKDYCLFFSDELFTRIFGTVNGEDFAYLQYADRPVQRLTDDGPLPDAFKDLNGFNFRTTVQTDLPRVFWYRNRKGEVRLGGYMARLFASFVHKHNATFTEILINNSSDLFMPGVIAATKNGDIDISMNTYEKAFDLEISYPILLQTWTILVPLNGYVDPDEYFLRPFTLTVWICICLTLVYIIAARSLKDFHTNEPVSVWNYFRDAFLLLLGMPTGTDFIRARRIHIQVILLSHILVNIYCVYLTSFLTIRIKVEQWNTIHDLIEHNVPVMMPHHEWEYLSATVHPYKGLEKIIKSVDDRVHMKERNSMRNLSFAYSGSMDKALFLLEAHKRVSKIMFHTTSDSLKNFHLGFLLVKHSPFAEILKTCILQVVKAGLIGKWHRDSIMHGYLAGLLPSATASQKLAFPLSAHHLHFAWTCLLIGWIIATVVFLCEQFCRW